MADTTLKIQSCSKNSTALSMTSVDPMVDAVWPNCEESQSIQVLVQRLNRACGTSSSSGSLFQLELRLNPFCFNPSRFPLHFNLKWPGKVPKSAARRERRGNSPLAHDGPYLTTKSPVETDVFAAALLQLESGRTHAIDARVEVSSGSNSAHLDCRCFGIESAQPAVVAAHRG